MGTLPTCLTCYPTEDLVQLRGMPEWYYFLEAVLVIIPRSEGAGTFKLFSKYD